jgi:GAF domain-containing protein
MIPKVRNSWQKLFSKQSSQTERDAPVVPETPQRAVTLDLDIAPDDPLMKYFVNDPDAVEIDKILLDSDALRALKGAGVKLVVPLVSQGELIGLLNLGPRLSEQDYSVDDRRLLNTLSTQAAPALRVAQLARQQQAEARERERIEQELRVARVIQQTLLPKELPELENWQLAAHWQPAREVSGDFYDFRGEWGFLRFFPFPGWKVGYCDRRCDG